MTIRGEPAVDPTLLSDEALALAVDAWNDTGDQPTRLAHLDHGDQCCILFKSYEGSAQIVQLSHGP
jgi:hypothetical protein